MMTAEALKKYSVPTGRIRVADDGSVIHDLPTGNAAGEEFVRMVDACTDAYGMTWVQALEFLRASQEGQEILRRYGQGSISRTQPYIANPREHPNLPDRPDIEIDRRARAHMDSTGEENYSDAVSYVLNADGELMRAYAKSVGARR